MQSHIAAGEQLFERGGIAVFEWAKPAHQLVLTVYHRAEEGALVEIWSAVYFARLAHLFLSLTARRTRTVAHIGQELENTCDSPGRVEHVQPVPAEQRPVAGIVRTPARTVLPGVENRAPQTASLDVRVSPADFLRRQSGELQEGGGKVEV